MNTPQELAELTIASLRTAQHFHQQGYWKASGKEHYSLHKLYNHILEPIEDQLDELGNRFVEKLGANSLSIRRISYLNKKFTKEIDLAYETQEEKSLAAEELVLDLFKRLYDSFDESGLLSLGTDDMIMKISNDHEDAVYHLKQTMS